MSNNSHINMAVVDDVYTWLNTVSYLQDLCIMTLLLVINDRGTISFENKSF